VKVKKVQSFGRCIGVEWEDVPIGFGSGITIPQHLIAFPRPRELKYAVLLGSAHFNDYLAK